MPKASGASASPVTSSLLDEGVLADFANRLRTADYTVDAISDLLGAEALSSIPLCTVVAKDVLSRDTATTTDRALAILTLLFVCATSVTVKDVEEVLPAASVEGLLRIGVLAAEGESTASAVRTNFDVRPYSFTDERSTSEGVNLVVLSDLGTDQTGQPLPRDYVLGIGQASLTLAGLIPRTPVERALDLGCGCGIQTFHLLRHADHVTATDISQRALDITRANLLLNAQALDIDPDNLEQRVTLVQGSLLEPVAEQRFDLIATNPPFVITPRSLSERAEDQYTYRDGGQPGDRLVAELVSGVSEHLAPGASAFMLANWEMTDLHDPFAGPRTWVHPDASAWFVQREVESPAEYALTWLRDAGEDMDSARYEQQLKRYLDDFDSRNVAGIGFGYVLVHRQIAVPAWHRFEAVSQALSAPMGNWWARAVVLQNALQALGDAAFGELKLAVREDVTEERHHTPGAEHPQIIMLRQGSGWRRTRQLDTASAGFVSACDGTLSVRAIIGALEALLEPEDENFARALLDEARQLVLLGFLDAATLGR